MILKEFSKYIQGFSADIPAIILLPEWLKEKIRKKPEDNVDKIIQKEISLVQNKKGVFLMVARSESGRVLLDSLYEFAMSFDNHKFNKWLHKVKASDFKCSE